MHFQQAFGMLMAKWRTLHQLHLIVETLTLVICVAMKLHNCVIQEGGEMTPYTVGKSEMESVHNELTS